MNTNGSGLWRITYRVACKEKTLSLGVYPDLSLVEARQVRAEARQQMADGIDPNEQKKAAKVAQKVEGLTLDTLASEWYDYNAPRWVEATAYKARLYLDNDILPRIGEHSVVSITRPELVELVRTVEARGTLNAAGKIRQWLHQIFRYGLARGVVEANPATDLNVVAAPAKAARHHPHVTFGELPDLMGKVEAANIHTLTRLAIRLLILTAVRKSMRCLSPRLKPMLTDNAARFAVKLRASVA